MFFDGIMDTSTDSNKVNDEEVEVQIRNVNEFLQEIRVCESPGNMIADDANSEYWVPDSPNKGAADSEISQSIDLDLINEETTSCEPSQSQDTDAQQSENEDNDQANVRMTRSRATESLIRPRNIPNWF